jgi:SAM-dependent methyltransferase
MSDGSSTARIAELLRSGPVAPPRSRGRWLRRLARKGMLRALRPYSAYQHQLNEAILAAIEAARRNEEWRSEREADLVQQLRELKDLVDRQVGRINGMQRLADDIVNAVQRLSGTQSSELRPQVARLAREAELWRSIPYVAGDPFERYTKTVGDVTGFRAGRISTAGGSHYVGFEDVFRGPPERVRELQLPYVELVADHQPVLDVGCGRGEFLTLLTERGIDACGIDIDPGMIERSRAEGLSVQEADAVSYLERLDDRTLGTVFSMQVIEHLPVGSLRRMLELACRKLVPGGLMIAETINPHSNPAFKTFWVDLTHQHPIFPEVALAFCGLAGFESAYVFAPGHDSFEDARFEADRYAVVATAPMADDR